MGSNLSKNTHLGKSHRLVPKSLSAHGLVVLLPFDLLQHLIVTSLLRAILLHYRVFLKCYFFLITEFVGMDLQVRIITILEMYTEM